MTDVSNRSRTAGRFATEALTAADIAAVDLPDDNGPADAAQADDGYPSALRADRARRRAMGDDDEASWVDLEDGDARMPEGYRSADLYREADGSLGAALALRRRDEHDYKRGMGMRVTAAEGVRDLERHEVSSSQGHTFHPDGTRVAITDQDEETGERIRRMGVAVGRGHGLAYDEQLVRLDDGAVVGLHPNYVQPDGYSEWTSGRHHPAGARHTTRNGHELTVEPMTAALAVPQEAGGPKQTHYWSVEMGPTSSFSGSAGSEEAALREVQDFSDGIAAAQVRNARERAAEVEAYARELRG